MAIHKFTRLLWEGKKIPRFGDGTTARDYTFVDDIVDGIVAALERPNGFEILNLGNSHPVQLADLIDRIAALVGRPVELESLSEQAGDARRTHSDISKSGKMLGYKPKVELDDGLARFVTWFRSERTG
jgi:UDP-glucuronate 4-epimerase